MTINWRTFFIGLIIVFVDVIIYIVFGVMMMAYDDSYDESKGEYWSLESMTVFDKTIYFSIMLWNIINLLAILFILFNFVKQIRTKYFDKN